MHGNRVAEDRAMSSRGILSVVVGLKFAWCGVTSCQSRIFMGAVRGRTPRIRVARVVVSTYTPVPQSSANNNFTL